MDSVTPQGRLVPCPYQQGYSISKSGLGDFVEVTLGILYVWNTERVNGVNPLFDNNNNNNIKFIRRTVSGRYHSLLKPCFNVSVRKHLKLWTLWISL